MQRGTFVALLLIVAHLAAETRGRAVFRAPADWTADVTPSFSAFRRIQGSVFCQVSIYDEQAAGASLGASFAQEWTGIFGRNFRPGPPPRPEERRSEAGYRFAEGEAEVTDARGNRFWARVAVFETGANVQSAVGIASNRATLEACGAEWAAFLGSLRYPDRAGTPAPPESAREGDAAARPGTFGTLRYTLPLGWSTATQQGAVRLSPGRLQPGEELAVFLLPARPEGPLDREFAATFAEIAGRHGGAVMRNVSGQGFDLDEPRRTARGVEHLTGQGGITIDGRIYSVRPFVFRLTGRVERVYVLSADFRAELVTVTTLSNPRLEREVYRLLTSLRFAGMPETAARAAEAEGPGVTGVWGGSAMSFGSLKPHLAVLLSDGSAYFGPRFPAQGLFEIDPAAARELAPRDWGTWTFQNGAGEVRMPYGAIPVRQDGNVLVVTTANTPHRFVKLPALTAAAIAGNWCFDDGGPCLALAADGRFRDGGAARVLEHSTYPYPEAPEGGNGTWAVRSHTLLLRYDNGREVRIAVPGLADAGGGGRPPRLWMSFALDALSRH